MIKTVITFLASAIIVALIVLTLVVLVDVIIRVIIRLFDASDDLMEIIKERKRRRILKGHER